MPNANERLDALEDAVTRIDNDLRGHLKDCAAASRKMIDGLIALRRIVLLVFFMLFAIGGTTIYMANLVRKMIE